MILNFYRKFSNLLIPFILLFFLYRLLNLKETLESLKQKFGFYTFKRPKKEIIWLHAVSIGESLSMISVIKELNKSKRFKVLLTTSTITSAKIIKDRYSDLLIHQFAPIDIPIIINKFLNYWNPKISIFSESELWPNLLLLIKKKKIKLFLLNGRMSKNTFSSWSRFPKTSKKILESFDLSFIQDSKSLKRFERLGLENTKHTGNLKFLSDKPPISKKEYKEFRKNLEGKFIICLCSSHKGEEKIIIQIFKNLIKKKNNLFLIIIPRHIRRRKEIEKIIFENRLNHILRSKKGKFGGSNCMLADTFGEVGLFLKLSNLVLMGGTFVKKGGQNPIEGYFFKCPTIIGPYYENFDDVVNILKKNKAIISVSNLERLTKVIEDLIQNKKDRLQIGNNLYNTCLKERKRNLKILKIINKTIYQL